MIDVAWLREQLRAGRIGRRQLRQRSGMVEIAEGAAAHQLAVGELSRDRMHHAHLQRLGRIERRQQGREAHRQHRLAGAGRADHQDVQHVKTTAFLDAAGATFPPFD
jgi:hypothetical protein